MSTARAWYVVCDLCGSPIGGNDAISVQSARDARQIAKGLGGTRRKVAGMMLDLCEGCTPRPKSGATSSGEDE